MMLRYFNTVTSPDKANEAANQLLCGLFRFVTMLPGPGEKRFKRHIREVSVHQLQFKNNGLQYLLLCKKFFFDDSEISAIIRNTAYVFDCLHLDMDVMHRIIAIKNIAEIQRKWERQREIFRKNHAGDAFEQYVGMLDERVYVEEKLIAFLESDTMYGLFFQSLRLCDNIEERSMYKVQHAAHKIMLCSGTAGTAAYEQFVFEKGWPMESLKIVDTLQNEVLCLGLKR
ncbi:hypothetical protein ACL9RF_14320 [Sphingobacterium sp. Mn56C]|uniref:hypothetical protein n=1 Tax=Sphingobacterium sp. Mn56C TaxID=3395261 RepID=UPI003BCC477D